VVLAESPVYAGCEDVTGEWGKPCPTCGETLPDNTFTRAMKRREDEREARIYLYHDPDLTFGSGYGKEQVAQCGRTVVRSPCTRPAGHTGKHRA
jgi:hypothetical protein